LLGDRIDRRSGDGIEAKREFLLIDHAVEVGIMDGILVVEGIGEAASGSNLLGTGRADGHVREGECGDTGGAIQEVGLLPGNQSFEIGDCGG
jgi:hypothetical protein